MAFLFTADFGNIRLFREWIGHACRVEVFAILFRGANRFG